MTAQLTEMDGRKPLADKDIKSIAPIEPAAKEDAKAGAEAKADGGSGGGGGGNANAAGGDGDGGGSGGGDDGGSGGDDAAPADDGSGDGDDPCDTLNDYQVLAEKMLEWIAECDSITR